MKILIFRTSGTVVNFSTYNLQEIGLAKGFINNGAQCDIIYFGGKINKIQKINYLGSTINIFWKKGISIFGNGIFFDLKIIDNYDIVQISDYDQLSSYFYYAISKYKPKVTLYHGPYLNDFNKKYKLKSKIIDFLPKQKKVLSNLPCFTKSELASEFLRKRGFKNIINVGVGLDVDRFHTSQIIEDSTLKILDEIRNKKVLLYVGLLEKRRNTIFLIDLLAELIKNDKDIILLLIGKGAQDYVEKCKSLVREKGLEKYVLFCGNVKQEQLQFIYPKCNIFLLPSSYEIFGMVLLEAVYFNLPVITTFNGGAESLIVGTNNGYVCKLNVEDWKSKILQIFDNRESLQIDNKIITEKFSWNEIARKMLSVYYQMLENGEA